MIGAEIYNVDGVGSPGENESGLVDGESNASFERETLCESPVDLPVQSFRGDTDHGGAVSQAQAHPRPSGAGGSMTGADACAGGGWGVLGEGTTCRKYTGRRKVGTRRYNIPPEIDRLAQGWQWAEMMPAATLEAYRNM